MISWQTALDLYLQEAESAQRKSRITRPAGTTSAVVKRPPAAKKYTLVEPPPPPPAVHVAVATVSASTSARRAAPSSSSSSRAPPPPVVYFPPPLPSHAHEPTAPEALTSLQDLLHLEAAVLKDHRFRLHKLRNLGSQRAGEWALWDSEDALRSDPALRGDANLDAYESGEQEARLAGPGREAAAGSEADEHTSSTAAATAAASEFTRESRARRRARLAQLLSAFDSQDADDSEAPQQLSHEPDPRWWGRVSKVDISARYVDTLLGLAE